MPRLRTQNPKISALHPFELLDPYSYYLYQEPIFPRSRFSSAHSPLAHIIESAKESLDFEFNIMYPSFISVDFPRPYCVHPHHHQYHSFPMPLPSSEFLDAAVDQIFHNHAEAELYVRGLDDRLGTLDLGLGQDIGTCIDTPESKSKWTVEIKGKKGEGFDQKYKCTTETKGAFKKSVRWMVQYQGKGKYEPLTHFCAFHSASGLAHEDWEMAKKEKKLKKAIACPVEIDEGTEQQVLSKRLASAKRTVHRSKGKKKELSPQDAAMAIQKTFRDHMSRRSVALRSLRDLAVAKSKLKEIRASFSIFSYRYRLSKDAEERQRFSEKIIILLLTIDAIEGQDVMVHSAKRSMIRELEAVLEVVDPQPYRDLGSRRRKFDLPAVGSLSTEIAYGVADVVRLLDQEDGSNSILPDLSL